MARDANLDLDYMNAFYELTMTLGATLDLNHEINMFMSWLKQTIMPKATVLFLTDEERRHLIPQAAHGLTRPVRGALPLGLDPWRWLEQQHLLGEEHFQYPRYVVPITVEEQLLGTLCIVSTTRGDLLPREQTLAEAGAAYLAPVIRNIWRHQHLERLVEERTAALAQSESLFRSLVEQSSVGVYAVNVERFLYVNRVLAEFLGYSVDELRRMSPIAFLYPEEQAPSRERLHKRLTGELPDQVLKTLRVRHRDGHPVYLEVYGRRVTMQGEPALLGTAVNITDRVYAEEAYHAVVDHTVHGITIIQDNRVVFANDAFARATGYTMQEILNFTPEELRALAHPEDQDRVWRFFQRVLEKRLSRAHTAFRYVRKDGNIYWVEVFANTITYRGRPAILITYTDITERKRAEVEIHRRTSQLEALNAIIVAATTATELETLLETVLDRILSALELELGVIWVVSPHEGEPSHVISRGLDIDFQDYVLMCHRDMVDFMAREGEEHPFSAVCDWSEVPAELQERKPFLQELNVRSTLTVPLVVEGRYIGGLSLASREPHLWQPEEIHLALAVARQISVTVERLQLIAKLRETNARLAEALRAKEEMLQNVSHELRTPLTMIRGYSELMEEEALGPLTPEQREAIHVMLRHVERLHFMVDRLLLLRSLDEISLEPEEIHLPAWLREIQAAWQHRVHEQGVNVVLDVVEDIPPLMADRRLMTAVMDNLLDNALKFCSEGDTITLRARVVGNEIILCVQDEGVGIPPDQLDRIFDRFYQVSSGLSRRYGGMGIGLALCKQIVEMHGGRIWAESEGEGKGATFCVALPLM